MKDKILSIILTFAILAIIGCAESARKTSPRHRSLKLDDIKPILTTKMPVEIIFQIVTFEIPSENVSMLDEIFGTLRQKTLHFKDPQGFGPMVFLPALGKTATGIGLARNSGLQKPEKSKPVH